MVSKPLMAVEGPSTSTTMQATFSSSSSKLFAISFTRSISLKLDMSNFLI